MPSVVRLATLNLFNNAHGRWADREALVHEQAAALDADVLTLQECDLRGPQIPRLLEALGPAYRAVPARNPSPASIKSLAVVTRLAVEASEVCDDLGSSDIALRVDLRTTDGSPLEVATTHLHFGPSRRGSEIRAAQVRRLLDWIGPVPQDRRLVLTGDFNATESGDTIKAIKRVLPSAHELVHGAEPESTHPTRLVEAVDTAAAFGVPLIPEGRGHAIDYVFVAPSLDVLGCRLAFDRPSLDDARLFPSDHFGLVAEVRIP